MSFALSSIYHKDRAVIWAEIPSARRKNLPCGVWSVQGEWQMCNIESVGDIILPCIMPVTCSYSHSLRFKQLPAAGTLSGWVSDTVSSPSSFSLIPWYVWMGTGPLITQSDMARWAPARTRGWPYIPQCCPSKRSWQALLSEALLWSILFSLYSFYMDLFGPRGP